ncbi:MAG: nicotinamide-nucleotide amidohydrolase family protein [Actinobacteria bacterium]|nr:nicotinamide-nucleotide amidohydrolase family protein [Actinomycetota bacterium]
MLLVGDDPALLAAALEEGLGADLCVISGGLGPTHDDRTVELLARATGRRLVVDAALEGEIEQVARDVAARLERPYADFEPGVRKQASLPEGAQSLGLAGTAPAVLLEHERGVAVALPGPPGELRRLWPAALASEEMRKVLERAPAPAHRILRFFGPSESAVARALDEAGGERDGLAVTVCAANLEIQVDLYWSAKSAGEGAAVAGALRDRFGDELFAEDERGVADLVVEACRGRGYTLATAESCTGGLVATRLTAVPGSSEIFLGAIVAYADEVKRGQLGVPGEMLERHGAVSAEAARAMAAGARAALKADVAVAVTGIAGPGGGSEAKPVGLVHVVATSPEAEIERELRLPGDREEVRARATAVSLHALRGVLTQTGTHSRAVSS